VRWQGFVVVGNSIFYEIGLGTYIPCKVCGALITVHGWPADRSPHRFYELAFRPLLVVCGNAFRTYVVLSMTQLSDKQTSPESFVRSCKVQSTKRVRITPYYYSNW
jgi:hypothetical protein